MQLLEENTERLDLLERTLVLEQRQRKRLLDVSVQKQKEIEQANRVQLYQGTNSTTNSILNQEEAQRKELVDAMVQNSPPIMTPVVKVLTNLQGITILGL